VNRRQIKITYLLTAPEPARGETYTQARQSFHRTNKQSTFDIS